MCTPLAIGGLVLTAASTLMNSQAQSSVNDARNDAMAAENIRQKRYDDEARGLNKQAQDRYGGFDDKQGERAGSLADFFTKQSEATAPAAPKAIPASDSAITVNEQARRGKESSEYGGQQSQALGNLTAFGNLFGDIGRQTARDATSINQVGGFKRGSAGVLPFELEAANEAGGSGLFADILGGLGGLGTSAGLAGSFGAPVGATGSPLPLVKGLPAAAKAGAGAASPAFGGSLYTLY
jgi:hypothetical protein